uniref:P-type domain-containing protein n=2 Tax=Caenorhabditis japonica TaxID=281687 RepID=A0A8R1I933_CAEJA
MGKLPILLLSIALVLTEAGPRFDCFPEPNGANQQACEARGCVWSQDNSGKNAPWCYFKDGVGYNLDSQSGSTYNLRKNNGPGNPWGGDFTEIKLTTKTIGNVLNVKVGVDGRVISEKMSELGHSD